MKKQTKLVNKFLNDFCFSNKIIACYHLDIDLKILDALLNGDIQPSESQIFIFEDLLSSDYPISEVSALENIVLDLTMINKYYEQIHVLE